MTNTLLEQDISALFGFDAIDEGAQEAFAAELGEVAFDTALVRFTKKLDEQRMTTLEHYLATKPTTQTLLKHFFTQYPDFESILEEVVLEIKEDAIEVLSEI